MSNDLFILFYMMVYPTVTLYLGYKWGKEDRYLKAKVAETSETDPRNYD